MEYSSKNQFFTTYLEYEVIIFVSIVYLSIKNVYKADAILMIQSITEVATIMNNLQCKK